MIKSLLMVGVILGIFGMGVGRVEAATSSFVFGGCKDCSTNSNCSMPCDADGNLTESASSVCNSGFIGVCGYNSQGQRDFAFNAICSCKGTALTVVISTPIPTLTPIPTQPVVSAGVFTFHGCYGCNASGTATCNDPCDADGNLLDSDVSACGTGYKALCGYNRDGARDYMFNGICSCRKLTASEPTPKPSYQCTCSKNTSGNWQVNGAGGCDTASGDVPQCTAGTSGAQLGQSCICGPPGLAKKDVPTTTTKNNNYLCSDGVSVDTALGCVPVQMDKFIAWLLPVLFSISGGIAFLLMVYGFILITTSNGDPKAVQGAKETITSAVIGLLISIFAIFILRLITVGILKIPGIS